MSLARSGLKGPSKVAKPATATSTGKAKSSSATSGPSESPSARSGDDFIIGDRVYVGGTKPGHIAYIGETQFASGEWVGVVLDEPIGKNDGTVNGVHYFQCEPMKGVFARISKIKREPMESATSSPTLPSPSSGIKPPTVKATRSIKSSSSQNNLNSPYGSMSSLTGDGQDSGKLRVGDRVLVSGTKKGTLRFIGCTEFARGEWAGVELDEPMGKNDGSVAGKRYFACKPLYGLFAPVHKVSRLAGGDASTPIKTSMLENRLALGYRRESLGSQDSVSSIGSSASSVSRSRVRLGVTSLNSPKKTAQRPSKLGNSYSVAGLQKALKEKEDHIEQLLKERDMERSEVARAAAQVDEAEGKLMSLKSEHERVVTDTEENMNKLRNLVQTLESEKSDLAAQLDEEKRKVEDYEFRIEEEEINKEDIEEKSGADSARLAVVEKALLEEKKKNKTLEGKVEMLKPLYERAKTEVKEAEDTATAHLDKIEELTHSLHEAEDKLKAFSSGAGSTDGQKLISERDAKIRHLEHSLQKLSEDYEDEKSKANTAAQKYSNLEVKMSDMEEELRAFKQKFRQADENCQRMEMETKHLHSQLGESNRSRSDSNVQFTQKVDDLTTSLRNAQNEIASLTQNLETLNEDLKRANKSAADKDEALNKLESALKSKETDLHSAEENYNNLHSDLTHLKGKCKQQDHDMEELQSKLKMTEEKHEHLSSVKTKLEHELMDLMKNSGDSASQYLTKIEELSKNLSEAEEKMQTVEEDKRAYLLQVKQMTDSMNEKEELIKGLMTSVEEKDKTIMSSSLQLSDVSGSVSKLESSCKQLQLDLDDKEAKYSASKQKNAELANKVEELEDKVSKLTKESMESTSSSQDRISSLEYRLSEMQDKCRLLEVQNKNLSSDLNEIQSESMDKKSEIKQLREVVEAKSTECSSLIRDLEESRDQVDAIRREFTDLTNSMHGTVGQLSTSQSDCDALRATITRLEADIEIANEKYRSAQSTIDLTKKQLSESLDECRELKNAKANLESNLGNMNKSSGDFSVRISNLESRLRDRDAELETVQSVLVSYVKKLANVHDTLVFECGGTDSMVSRISSQQTATNQQMDDVLLSLESKVKDTVGLLSERKALQNRLNELETKHKNGVDSDISDDSKQVDFLNSVIVDLQRRNGELQAKLEAMESGSIFGGSNHSSTSPVLRKTSAPRLFCDICEVFDQHDTEDCPCQTMSDCETYRQQTQASRGLPSQRPFCGICETFGHTEDECNDDQTF